MRVLVAGAGIVGGAGAISGRIERLPMTAAGGILKRQLT